MVVVLRSKERFTAKLTKEVAKSVTTWKAPVQLKQTIKHTKN